MKKKINKNDSHQYGTGSDISKGLGVAASAASAIPGIGTAVGAGLSVLSGVAEGFDVEENEAAIKEAKNNIRSLYSASSYDDLSQLQQAAQTQINEGTFYNTGFLADLFGTASKREAQQKQQLREQLSKSLVNATNNLNIEQGLAMKNNVIAEGGSIHIDPSKKGTFTAAATKHHMGVQEFANKVLANKDDYSTAMVRKANFARNASKWHAEGGNLFTNGGDFTNGVNYVANGGTHEENPNGGVQMGIAPDGIKNTVEEGEVIYDDYVFSKRLKLDKEDAKNNFGLGGDLSFADAALKISKESQERPNDPISKNGLDSNMYKLQILQEELKARREAEKQNNQFAFGGHKYSGTTSSAKSTLSFKMPLADDAFKRKFSVTIPKVTVPTIPSMDFSNLPVDTISRVTGGFENIRTTPTLTPTRTDTLLPTTPAYKASESSNSGNTSTNTSTKQNSISSLNYAPAIGSAIGAIKSLFDQPDYSSANAIQNYATTRPRAKYTPLGDYVAYQPKDYSQYLNNLEAQQASTRRGLTTEAARIAADYNANVQRGNLLSKINEARMNDRLQVANFNRGTNQANAQLALQADNINAGIDRTALSGLAQAAQLRAAEDQALSANSTAQLTTLFNNLGNVGKQQDAMNNLQWAMEHNLFGKISAANGGYIPKSKKSRRK